MKKVFGIIGATLIIFSCENSKKSFQNNSLSADVDRDVLYASLEDGELSHANELFGRESLVSHTFFLDASLRAARDTIISDTLDSVRDSASVGFLIPLNLKDERVEKLQRYFAKESLPLESEAENFVRYADQNGVDWKLLPAISFVESTGGKHACKKASFNAFGWGGCSISFSSYEEAIATITMKLSGGYKAYKGKDLDGILKTYNKVKQPSYSKEVKREMKKIESM